MKLKRLLLGLIGLGQFTGACNVPRPNEGKIDLQQKRVPNQPPFAVPNPDYAKSPFTGVTRQHWKNAALYLLQGAFSYVNGLDDALYFPKQAGKSYPRRGGQTASEKLEGLCRTLFIAAPLLRDDSTLSINSIPLAQYYRHHFKKLLDPKSATYIEVCNTQKAPSQNLVEFGGLALSFFIVPDVLWQPLPQATKDALAARMLSYANGPTVPSNWKFFNVLILSFFDEKGYAVDTNLLVDYLTKIAAHYRGAGWYNDNPAYDYYSMWGFQLYGIMWSHFYGEKKYPAYAAQFRQRFAPVKNSYPYLFGRQGEMIMWGRSSSYRFAAAVPFPIMGLKNDPGTNYGWMRRIASGALLQFLQNPQLLQDNVPTLGFYGAFEPAVQNYSCRGSVYWMGKLFLGLLIPENSPFWTATENEGPWATTLQTKGVSNIFLDSSGILITNYAAIGASEVRAWCHVPVVGKKNEYRASENYNRLSYNSAFPWQADSIAGVVAMNYLFKTATGPWQPLQLFTFRRFENGTYYRDAVLETNKNININLADIPLPNGILRIDRNRSTEAAEVRLGHYALPQLNGAITNETRTINGQNVAMLDNGVYQLAMLPLRGWKQVSAIDTKGVHPQSNNSAVLNVADDFEPHTNEPTIYATLLLWKKSGQPWTDAELTPVKKVTPSADGAVVTVLFTDGTLKEVRF